MERETNYVVTAYPTSVIEKNQVRERSKMEIQTNDVIQMTLYHIIRYRRLLKKYKRSKIFWRVRK